MAKKRLRQKKIPGMEDGVIQELEDAVHNYDDAKRERMKATEAEVQTKTTLIEKMISHGVDRYVTADNCVAAMTQQSNIKVTRSNASPEDDGDGE
jgi:hypothetical protein